MPQPARDPKGPLAEPTDPGSRSTRTITNNIGLLMTTPTLSGLVARAKGILVSPSTEWPIIASEASTPRDIFLFYVAPLAAIGAIASFIGSTLIGFPVPLIGTVRLGFFAGLSSAIVMFALAFVGVFVLALIVDKLAPTFDGQSDSLRALKLVAYSYTPAWIAGILHLVPVLNILLLIASLYGLYIMYLGLPVMMRNPREKSAVYMGVLVVCSIALFLLIGLLASCVGGMGMGLLSG